MLAPDVPTLASTRQPERRRVERSDPSRVLRCRIVPAEAGPAPGAALLDISPHGAGLLISRRLTHNSKVILQLTRDRGPRPIVLSARVVYCADADNGRWLLGCEFARPLTTDELAGLLT